MIKRYLFENQMLTVIEIGAMVPCLHAQTIRKYLSQGLTTKQEMLSINPGIAWSNAGKASRKKVPFKYGKKA